MILTLSFISIITSLLIFIRYLPTASHPLVHALTLILSQTQQMSAIIPNTEIKEHSADGDDNRYKVSFLCF